jgi:hypothetical protein
MSKSKSRKKKAPKRVLALPDLEHAKTAVLNSLTSVSGQRTYDHAIREFVAWYCSEPLAFNRTVVDGVRVTSTTAARRSSRRSTRWVGSRRIPSRSNPMADQEVRQENRVLRARLRERDQELALATEATCVAEARADRAIESATDAWANYKAVLPLIAKGEP